MNKVEYIIVHHSGGTDADPLADSSGYTLKQCDADHKVRFNMKSSLGYYVGYTYFIDKKGVVTQTRKDGETGAHTIGYNSKSIGICLAGNFDATLPTPDQVKSLTTLLESKSKEFAVPKENIIPHRTFAHKTCYGKKLSDSWARELLGSLGNDLGNKEIIVACKFGDKGIEVEKLQKKLEKEGLFSLPPGAVYGSYGNFTRVAVISYQRKHNLTPDGIIGPETLKVLNR